MKRIRTMATNLSKRDIQGVTDRRQRTRTIGGFSKMTKKYRDIVQKAQGVQERYETNILQHIAIKPKLLREYGAIERQAHYIAPNNVLMKGNNGG